MRAPRETTEPSLLTSAPPNRSSVHLQAQEQDADWCRPLFIPPILPLILLYWPGEEDRAASRADLPAPRRRVNLFCGIATPLAVMCNRRVGKTPWGGPRITGQQVAHHKRLCRMRLGPC